MSDFKRRPDPDQWALNELAKQGWNTKGRHRQCPACVQKEKEDKAVKRTISAMPSPLKLSSPEGQAALATLKAEPPRTPTREDNKRITTALDAYYDETQQHYATGYSDEWLGEKLDMPRAWIAKVREDFYGPELSAAEAAARTQLDALAATSRTIMADALDLAARAESHLADITRVTANLARKAG